MKNLVLGVPLAAAAVVLCAYCACSQPSDGGAVSTPKEPLTAEQVFAANFKHGMYVSGGIDVSDKFEGIDAGLLSREELAKYQTMIRAGKLNDLILFFNRCMPTPVGTQPFETIFKKWQALPDQLRSESRDREVAEINASGWPEFCSAMKTRIRIGYYNLLISTQ
jgi:hypothetical protein